MARSDRFKLIALAGIALLTACGKGDKDAKLATLDAQLTNNAIDPALRGGLGDQIVVDPKLAGQPDRNAGPGDAKTAAAEAQRLAGGKLLSAPAPVAGKPTNGATLGALAREQGYRTGVDCKAKLAYAAQWATRMPEPFAVYPGAQLTEAAGAEGEGCTLRAASFITSTPRQGVLDYYYTQARRAGYDGEHQVLGGDHVLGGTRANDKAAYLIVVRDAPSGKTSVDILADGGR